MYLVSTFAEKVTNTSRRILNSPFVTKSLLFVVNVSGVFHQISRLSTSEVVGPSPIKSEIASLLGVSGQGSSFASGAIAPASFHVPFPYIHFSNPFTNPSHSSIQAPGTSGASLSSLNISSISPPTPAHKQEQEISPFSLCMSGFFPSRSDFIGTASGGDIELPQNGSQCLDNQQIPLPPSSLATSTIKAIHTGSHSSSKSGTKSSKSHHGVSSDSAKSTPNNSKSSSSMGESSSEKNHDDAV